MKEKRISIRGKSTTIRYIVVDNGGLVYARVTWDKGTETLFYKGMYNKPEWFAKGIPADLIMMLSPIFDQEQPLKIEQETNHGHVP
ncbi:hypothetical protein [Sphingobacterium haloxyli]|uniref:Uncharacterized protein n=1 Tax=Sphingobacterium haloxyli TaxID=2100533 RepID=A0A2S9J4D2_9SPHI|nr:hypothetical protein [Sphingobacterium haloxyli]PRD47589.1 hypothetical protein C5745_09755 [Sphingobacterium haloxyli]